MLRCRSIEASERSVRRETAKDSQFNEKETMRRTTIILVCTMIAPLAFAQTVAKTSGVEHTGITQKAPTQITTGAVLIGTVIAFNAGQRPIEAPSPIVVQSSPDTKPVSYMLGKKVRYADKDGRAIDPHLVRPGTRVQLGFDRRGRVARVTVVQR